MAADQIPMVTALDTSVIIPSLLSWHAHHETASFELTALLESESEIVIPLQSLVEAYAVMTRLPPPHRLSAKNALEILEGSFRHRTTIIGLDGDEGWNLIGDLGHRAVAGGTSYDGLVLACARKGGARRILTFNRSHFERIGPEEIEILVPGTAL